MKSKKSNKYFGNKKNEKADFQNKKSLIWWGVIAHIKMIKQKEALSFWDWKLLNLQAVSKQNK